MPPDIALRLAPTHAVALTLAGSGGRLTLGPPARTLEVALSPMLRGEPGDGGLSLQTAAHPLSGHRIVTLNGAGLLVYASNADIAQAHRIGGISTNAADAGGGVFVQRSGPLEEPSWSWSTSDPVFLGADGALTQVPPAAPDAGFQLVVGFPISATKLFINIGIPVAVI